MNAHLKERILNHKRGAFTLIELLVVIGIIALLVGLVLPSLSKARDNGRTVVCLSRLRELGKGWQMYADDNDNVILPGRMFEIPGGKNNPDNWYDVGNGLKYRPRWVATMGAQVGVYAFNEPLTRDKDGIKADRQVYDNETYQCPSEPGWNDERNFGYGYNHQFLGNARQTNHRFHNFPVLAHKIKASSGTVVAADCMGTAAGFGKSRRVGYSRDGTNFAARGNHGWSLDPPRLTDESDRGTGEAESPRTAVDARHQKKANAIFADGHGATMTPYKMGYRVNNTGRFVDYDPTEGGSGESDGGAIGRAPRRGWGPDTRYLQADPLDDDIDGATNRLFSGSGRDDDPPPLPDAVQ